MNNAPRTPPAPAESPAAPAKATKATAPAAKATPPADPAVPVIAIDGPVGVGKGTLAQALARRLGWHYLESGALYRVLGLLAERRGVALDDAPALAALAGVWICHSPSPKARPPWCAWAAGAVETAGATEPAVTVPTARPPKPAKS